jgi:DinB superfamily
VLVHGVILPNLVQIATDIFGRFNAQLSQFLLFIGGTMSADPRYPIGVFVRQATYSSQERTEHLKVLSVTAQELREAVAGLSATQLDTPYRDGGWTVRQVTHHLPDSHMNAYIRIKCALTELEPLIKPYDEETWALLMDTRQVPLEVSISLLEAIHVRLLALLGSLDGTDWSRTYRHPVNGVVTVEQALAEYAWHSKHHLKHITQLRASQKW